MSFFKPYKLIFIISLFFSYVVFADDVNVNAKHEGIAKYDNVLKKSNDKVLRAIPLHISDIQSTSRGLSTLSENVNNNGVADAPLKLNLLDIDELIINYRPVSGDGDCVISGDLNVLGLPLKGDKVLQQSSVNFNISSGGYKNYGGKVLLNGPVKPRSIDYLIRRHIGLHANSDWNFVNEGELSVFMRLFRINLRNVSVVEFEMDSAVERVNLKLSRSLTGKPTDIVEWHEIPKLIVDRGATRLVRLDFTTLIRNKFQDAYYQDSPLNLVEIITFIEKKSVDKGGAPIKWIQSYHNNSDNKYPISEVRVLSYTERVSADLLRWRFSMSSLRQLPFEEILFISGNIASDLPSCLSSLRQAEMVILKPQALIVAKHDANSSLHSLRDVFSIADFIYHYYKNYQYLFYLVFLFIIIFILWWYLSELILVQVNKARNFVYQNRQKLYLLLLLLYLFYVLHSSNWELFFSSQLSQQHISLLFFSGFAFLHSWRWRLQSSLREIGDMRLQWVEDQANWLSSCVLLLIGLIFVLIFYFQWQVYFLDADEYDSIVNFNTVDLYSYLEMIFLKSVLVLIEGGVYSQLFLCIGYGLLPWIFKCVCWIFSTDALFARWALVTLLLYGIGMKDIAQPGENYYFTFGALTFVFALRSWMLSVEQYYREHSPQIAEVIYGRGGNIYFSLAVVMLLATAAVLSVRIQIVAEQLSIVSYYCLVIATVLELVAQKRAN